MNPKFSICVYCGSRPGTQSLFTQTATEVGEWIGAHQGQLVYGGGSQGLMGTVARAAKSAGAKVVGVIPHALAEKKTANEGCDELYRVDNMHQRKFMMAERADAFLALPGGIGTFEELFEVWTWRQLGYHNKPIGLLNVNGYYDGLLEFMQHTVRQGFVSDWQLDYVLVSDRIDHLLPDLVQAAGMPQADKLTRI